MQQDIVTVSDETKSNLNLLSEATGNMLSLSETKFVFGKTKKMKVEAEKLSTVLNKLTTTFAGNTDFENAKRSIRAAIQLGDMDVSGTSDLVKTIVVNKWREGLTALNSFAAKQLS